MSTGAVIDESALTPWFAGDVKPVRKGFYQRDYDCYVGIAYPDYWDGSSWYMTIEEFVSSGIKAPADLPWRGLAADPAGGAK